MGQSTDAILFYGYCWEDEHILFDNAEPGAQPEYENIGVGSHCSCDYPMPFIYIEDTKLRAWRGRPVEVTFNHIPPSTIEWDESLSRFVEDLDIDVSEASGPGWFLVSMWC